MESCLKTDLHGTILLHATSLRHAYNTLGHNCRKVLKHVSKSYDFFRVMCVIKEVACDKIAPCKSALRLQTFEVLVDIRVVAKWMSKQKGDLPFY